MQTVKEKAIVGDEHYDRYRGFYNCWARLAGVTWKLGKQETERKQRYEAVLKGLEDSVEFNMDFLKEIISVENARLKLHHFFPGTLPWRH